MVHNMLATLQNVNELDYWENTPFRGVIPEPKTSKSDIKKPIKKKVKRNRTAFTTKQLRALELLFIQNKYITPERRREMSKALNLGDKSVKIWFQNRRMKEKRESSESSRVESDSSNETCCEKSAPSTVSTECYNQDLNENIANEKFSPETCQYQAQHFYANNMNEQQIQNGHASNYNTLHSSGMQFYNDSNMYPTQYYPHNDGTYINDYNYCHYQQEHSMPNYYWSANNSAPYCFYN